MATATSKPKVTAELIDYLKAEGLVPSTLTIPYADPFWPEKVTELLGNRRLSLYEYDRLTNQQTETRPTGVKSMSTSPSTVFARGGDVKVKAGSERYSSKRYVGKHCKTGCEVRNPFQKGLPTETPSEKDHALCGAFLKHLAHKAGFVTMTEHDRELVSELAERHIWSGELNGEWGYYTHVKALLDDATSGGSFLSPEVFDDAIVTVPLLSGELLPYVDLKPVPKGRVIQAAAVSHPTVTWSAQEGASQDVFDTDNLAQLIKTSVHVVSVFVECGRDFLADSPADVGAALVKLIGEKMASELDRVICSGDGISNPEGLFNASGVSVVTSENGVGGPMTLADVLTMYFSVGKAYRQAGRCFYVSNDTTYQRSRSIKIDAATPSTDQRPALAPLSDIASYNTLGVKHSIQNDLSNSACGFGRLDSYRMYRRGGTEIRWEQGGSTLAKANKILLCVRTRYGGQLMDGSAFSKCETFPA